MTKKPFTSQLKKPIYFIIFFLFILLSILQFLHMTPFSSPSSHLVNKCEPGIFFDRIDIFLYGLWIIGPPLFFLFEYAYIFEPDAKNKEAQFEEFKYSQELASKIWAALAVLFSIILKNMYGINL
jgi:hypothetical protein